MTHDNPPTPGDIWRVLRTNTTHVTNDLIAENTAGQRSYQVFEVVVARLMQVLHPHFHWVVTPVGQDGGIDFKGTLQLIADSEAVDPAILFIGGQCKIFNFDSKQISVLDVGKCFSGELAHMIQTIKRTPSLFMAVIIDDLEDEEIEKIRDFISHNNQYCVAVLARRQVEGLLGRFFDRVRPDIERCLTGRAELKYVLSYFAGIGRTSADDYSLEVQLSDTCAWEAGTPFDMRITVRSRFPLGQGCALRLEPIFYPLPWTAEQQPFELVTPRALLEENGHPLIYWNGPEAICRVRMIGYLPGESSIGTIHLSSDGKVQQSRDLPPVTLADTFSPPYFETDYLREYASRFDDAFARVRANRPMCIAVMGSGGSGKTRFVQQMALRQQRLGAIYTAIPHPKTFDAPYQVVCGLFCALVSTERGADISSWEAIHAHLETLNADFSAQAVSTLRQIFARPDKVGTNVDTGILSRILLLLLTARTNPNPLFIHLSDLHWCHPAILQLLADALSHLRESVGAQRRQALFLLEGRNYERSSAEETNELATGSEFQRVVKAFVDEVLPIQPMSNHDSREFLDRLIRLRARPDRAVPDRFIARRKALIEQILRFSNGNPFHIIEIIRYFRDKGIVFVDKVSQQIYLGENEPHAITAPGSLAELIGLRILYWDTRADGIGALLQALTLLSDQIDYALFARLRRALAPQATLQDLRQTEFVIIPEAGAGVVRFRHELYFQLVKERDSLTDGQRGSAVECYLNWVDQQPPSLQNKLNRALIMRQEVIPNTPAIDDLLQSTWSEAVASGDTLMEARLLGTLISLWGPFRSDLMHSEVVRRATLSIRHCDVVVVHGDRKQSANQLSELVDALTLHRSRVSDRLDAQARDELDYANGQAAVSLANACLDMCASDRSIRCLEEHLPLIRSAADHEEDRGLPLDQRRWGALLVSGLNRLGTALLLEGERDRSEHTQREAVGMARRRGDPNMLFEAMHDLGETVALAVPHDGLAILQNAVNCSSNAGDSRRRCLMARMTWYGALAMSWCRPWQGALMIDRAELRQRRDEIHEILKESKRNEFSQTISMATLLLGILNAFDDDYLVAEEWFITSVRVNAEARRYENLWKSHLNLAEILAAGGQDNRAAALHHAENAHRLLVDDLRRRMDPSFTSRLRRQSRPLAHLVQIWSRLHDDRAGELLAEFPSLAQGLITGDDGLPRLRVDWAADQTPCVFNGTLVFYPH